MSSSPLAQDILREFLRLQGRLVSLEASLWEKKVYEGTGGKVSPADLVAYQIGWGKAVIRWYEAGLQGVDPAMPGDGFTKWNYVDIAHHFYEIYHFDDPLAGIRALEAVVMRIIEIVEKEHVSGNLDRLGVWRWCTLPSGKVWPLSKWIRVNTASPYKKAFQILSK